MSYTLDTRIHTDESSIICPCRLHKESEREKWVRLFIASSCYTEYKNLVTSSFILVTLNCKLPAQRRTYDQPIKVHLIKHHINYKTEDPFEAIDIF